MMDVLNSTYRVVAKNGKYRVQKYWCFGIWRTWCEYHDYDGGISEWSWFLYLCDALDFDSYEDAVMFMRRKSAYESRQSKDIHNGA